MATIDFGDMQRFEKAIEAMVDSVDSVKIYDDPTTFALGGLAPEKEEGSVYRHWEIVAPTSEDQKTVFEEVRRQAEEQVAKFRKETNAEIRLFWRRRPEIIQYNDFYSDLPSEYFVARFSIGYYTKLL